MLFMALLAGHAVQAQPYWSQGIGGPGNDHVADVKTDAAGNIYATGEFSGVIQFGGSTYTSTAGIDMFLAKLSPTGQVLWFVQGGGPGIDRGIKLAVRNGQVVVVGTFMHTATFQGQSITSAGGPDIFLAMHDAATGSLQWIVQGGGPLASDRPYGVTIAGSGNVTMVGEFSGTVSIAGSMLSSMLDPQTMTPSVDVFIATYSPAGAPLWTRHGAAKYTDRAIDVVNDPADNIYVTGQFSDTVQFVSTHPNTMYHANFLLKLDAAGNEVWFRRMGGAVYNQVRDMQWTSADDLLLVGDLQGTMIFLDSAPDLIASGDPYAYFLLRVESDGELLASTVVTSLNQVSGRALDERAGTVTVLGQFECQFTSMVDSTHTGLWLATGEQDLFIVRHELDSLTIKDAQQFGGREEKLAGQVATLNDSSPIFCGSFEDMLVFPCQGAFAADIASVFQPYGLMARNMLGYCGDPHYGSFAADTSNGLKDGFIARGYVLGRAPYDWWDRSGASCDFSQRSLCLGAGEMAYTCTDTVEFCGPDVIGIRPDFAFSIDHRDFFVGPELDFLWSTGATTDSLMVSTTGMYSVTCTTTNGCLQWTDSIYVIIHPFPPQPLLSDDVVVATDSPNPYPISICDPTEVWIWCSNVDTTNTNYWSGSAGLVHSDSLLVDTSGTFHFNMVNAFGCTSFNSIIVIDHPNVPIPDVTVSLHITYPQDFDQNDSLELCPLLRRTLQVAATWELNGAPYTFPYAVPPEYYFGYIFNGDTVYEDEPDFIGDFPVTGSGWYVDTVTVFIINSPCGVDTLSLPTVVVDSIYVHVFPSVTVDIGLTGPSVICPSDTALLVTSCTNCDAVAWQGGGILSISGDSAYAIGGGNYQVTGSVVDTNGCSFSQNAYHLVSIAAAPQLDVFPPDGIICPDSIAIISTHALGNYTWYGPQGEIAINNDSIQVTIPGEYYLALDDANGCYLISDPILVTGYATPFLQVLPDGVLCIGDDPVLLQVVTTGYSSLFWGAPLSGNSLTQAVDQPGVYSCTVLGCGISTELSTEIIVGSAVAEVLTPGPFFICPGDTVVLAAADGQAVYFWNPGPSFGDSLLVTQTGSYILTVIDANGCSDTADAVLVIVHDLGSPLTVTDLTVCSGTPVSLHETAPGSFSWYADIALDVLLGSGPNLDLGTPTDSTVVYLVRSDSACTAAPIPVHVNVIPTPDGVTLDGPDHFCLNAPGTLMVSGPTDLQVTWSTPAGPYSGMALDFSPVHLADEGWYSIMPSLAGCPGAADSIFMAVFTPLPIELGPDTSFCDGALFILYLPPGFTDPLWSTEETGSSITVNIEGTYSVEATDANGCRSFASMLLTVVDCAPTVPNVITPNGDGVNDTFTFGPIGAISGELLVYNRWGNLVHVGNPVGKAWDGRHYKNGQPVSDGVYYYILRLTDKVGVAKEWTGYVTILH